MNHVEDHCCILKTLTDFCQIEYMSLCYMSLHAKPFIQHKLAMRLQLLATQTIGSRPLTTAMHFTGYQKPAKTEAQKKTSIFREELLSSGRKNTVRLQHRLPLPPDYTMVNDPHRELQNYSSCPISLLVLTSSIWFLILRQRCTIIRISVSLPFEYW
jgi:hypothetical protein